MIADNRPPNPRLVSVGQAALRRCCELASTCPEGRLADYQEDIGRASLAALVPGRCSPICPFYAAVVAKGKVLEATCFLGLQPLFGGRCPLRGQPQAPPPAEDPVPAPSGGPS